MSRDLHGDAEDAKTRGNECLNNKDYDAAIKWYGQALEFAKRLQENHNRHVYYSNRSAAYLSKGFAESALKDALAAIKEKPDWPKGYGRKGAALHFQKKYDEAIKAYEEGLAVAPNDPGLLKGIEEVKAEQNSFRHPPDFSGGMPSGGAGIDEIGKLFQDHTVMETLRRNPKTSQFMQDSSFLKTLELIQKEPQMLTTLLQSDKRLLTALSVLLGVNIKDPEERREEEERRKAEEAERERKRKEEAEAARRAAETPEERAQRERLEKAKAHKEAGNIQYKRREFDAALKEYDAAISEDPTDMTFYLNKASVYLELKDLDRCLAECDKAIEVGRANGAKYEQIAKAYERKGNAMAKFDKLEEALKEYRKAQLEFRTSEVDDRINKIDRTLKQQAEKEYINPELGLEASKRGNDLLSAGNFPSAVSEFTEAIKRDPTNASHYIDRCTAYIKLMDFGRAQEDVEKAIQINPNFVKAYAKKGRIETFTKKYHRALDSYRKGLELDPADAECKDGLRIVEQAIDSQSRVSAQEDENEAKIRHQRALEDPEIRAIMQDPVMMQVLRDLSTDPKSARQHLSNPVVASKIEKLIAAGIVKMG